MKLTLQFPVKDVFVTQRFGVDPEFYKKAIGTNGHPGIDFRAPDGTPVYASHDGVVTFTGEDGAGGLTVVIRTKEKYEYGSGDVYFKTVYVHLKKGSIIVVPNQEVKVGQKIAEADNTGLSSGSHLHFALKPIYQGEQDWQWYNLESTNGFFGSINPEQYFSSDLTPFKNIIKFGDVSDDVVRLQSFLLRKKLMSPIYIGFGTYGPRTRDAVKKYQISKGIPHNGGMQVGPLTLEALNKDYDL